VYAPPSFVTTVFFDALSVYRSHTDPYDGAAKFIQNLALQSARSLLCSYRAGAQSY
jgi:hypothetical protein